MKGTSNHSIFHHFASLLGRCCGRCRTRFVGFRPVFSLNYSHDRPIKPHWEYISDMVRLALARWRVESARVGLLSLVIAVANEIIPASSCRGRDLPQRRVQLPTASRLLIAFRRQCLLVNPLYEHCVVGASRPVPCLKTRMRSRSGVFLLREFSTPGK